MFFTKTAQVSDTAEYLKFTSRFNSCTRSASNSAMFVNIQAKLATQLMFKEGTGHETI